ncbi:hypothetical protein PAXRUDRAFT_828061 [Paxillus rubicundulus Ve08.2h10]|uniref:Uncharacterized protein n=1 Tax=Paxillus rubicundulus Ve08.2h10 TaxID=930991 RepID=A0A0D0DB71_9AGAM|nr:hypothetical protein PAXRUDRAFT_828061 [Paxillus rubicundulus Ve08.2h10]
MLPVANSHLKDLYETTVEFFTLRSPALSFRPFSSDDSDSDHEDIPFTPRDLSPVPDPINKLQKECAALRVKLHAAERTRCHGSCSRRSFGASAAASTLYTMRREYDATKSELQRSQVELAKWEERCKMLEKTLRETRDLVRTQEVEIETLKKERDRLIVDRRSGERNTSDRRRSQDIARHRSNSSQSLLSQHVRLSADCSELRDVETVSQASGSQRRNSSDVVVDNMSTVSEEERAQAKSTETFLTKTDLWSGAQVIQALQDLNSEILQFAASAVELCTFTKQHPAPAKVLQTKNEVSSRLGPTLTRILSTRDHSQDPMLVQMALQGCITYCISRALSSFCIGYQSKANITLTQIYTCMFQSEPQPTSARWRALAHKHIHELHPELDDYAINEMTETIFRWSSDVFLVCGSTNPQSHSSSREVFRSRFGAQVNRISNSACRLAQITREEIMSTNFEVVGADSGRTFDAQEMMDAFEDYGTSKGAVLCTTELGLRCSTRKASGEATTASEENVERRLLLRPKVVLESAVDMIDQR